MEQRRRAVRELGSENGLWAGAEVVCDVLCVVVEDVRMRTGIHGAVMVVDERLGRAWGWAVELVDGVFCKPAWGAWCTGRGKTVVFYLRQLFQINICIETS